MSKPITRLGLDVIGRNGLDTQTTPTTLSPEWFTAANNISYTEGGRVTFRKGLNQRTLSAPNKIGSLGESSKDGKLFAAEGGNVYQVDFDAATSFSSGFATGASSSDWQFMNFNNSFFGFQAGATPIRWKDSAWKTLEVYDATTAANGIVDFDKPITVSTFDPSCGFGQFGRLWVAGVTEEKDVVFYSKLLDESDFNDSNAGLIDLKTVWGTDEVVALASFGGKLVIFGKENIALYDNPQSPLEMQLNEVIKGIGCVSRDSIQNIGDDIFFLSETGVRSLFRTAETDKLPMQEKSLGIKDELIGKIKQSKDIKSVYMQDEGLYLLSFVALNITYVFDLAFITEERESPRVTTWSFDGNRHPSSFVYTETNGMVVGQHVGRVATYEGYYDTLYLYNSGTATITHINYSYVCSFSTPWLSLGEGGVAALLKRMQFVVDGGEGTSISIRLYKDFELTASFEQTSEINPPQLGTKFIWGAASSIYETAKYAPLYGFKEKSVPISGSAKYLRLEMSAETSGNKASLQGLSLLFLQGKTR